MVINILNSQLSYLSNYYNLIAASNDVVFLACVVFFTLLGKKLFLLGQTGSNF